MQQDCLDHITRQDVENLLNLLKLELPRSTVVYHWLLVQLKWSDKIPGVVVHILCPAGDWRTGTVVAFTQGLALNDKVYGVVYARSGNEDQLEHVLQTTRVIPWRHVLHFSGVLDIHVSAVTSAATAAGLVLPKQQGLCYLVMIEEERARHLRNTEIPERISNDVHIRQLQDCDLDQVWRLRAVFSDNYKPVIRACLQYNLSTGVFVTQADGTELLVSMVLQAPYGGTGMAATHPDHLHKGYNSLANAHIMCAMSKTKYQLHCHVNIENQIAVDFAIKNGGMKIVGKTCRVDIVPGEYKYFHLKPHL